MLVPFLTCPMNAIPQAGPNVSGDSWLRVRLKRQVFVRRPIISPAGERLQDRAVRCAKRE
jgi:hypothetical protein